jgi:hypothetical protein
MAMEAAMKISRLTKRFPAWERIPLSDQVRCCSSSGCAKIAETEFLLSLTMRCYYLDQAQVDTQKQENQSIPGKPSTLISHPEHWIICTVRELGANYA